MTRHAPITPTRGALTCNVTGCHAPSHAPYVKNIHILKENPTMALKREYKPTRGGARDLARDAKPGDTLYVVHDISAHVAPYEDSKLYAPTPSSTSAPPSAAPG